MTGGAFTAPTTGERAARIREWLAGGPSQEQMQEVFRELSARDKGAAKPLKEKLDELKRAKGQEAIAVEWAARGQELLALAKLNIADALAWQRDAAKAGAPLSKEPLATLKSQLAERVRGIEDLQHCVQVQREAAVLLAQRTEILSTKSWKDAQAAWEQLRADVAHWQSQADELTADANWASVDMKFPPQLESSRAQLMVVWDAFQGALSQAVAASQDAEAALPPVPVWADELRAGRGQAVEVVAKPARPKVDPEVRAQATQAISEALEKLESEISQGHGKASAGAAAALRNALKEHGKHVSDRLENQAHSALTAAGELEGWQRWRADQLRSELVAKAEGLLDRPEGQALGGRKMQETLRTLREQWKQTDQGGVPNHALWKRFDEACNEAYKVVESWLEKMKAEAAEHRAQRLALIEELKQWTVMVSQRTEPHDWKAFSRALHGFGDRWREAGHLSEKAFAELQPQWKAAMDAAAAPLEQAQRDSLARRHVLIEEAQVLGAAAMLRVDAVKALQQRWQQEAQSVPLDRKHEQKLWDAFRKPIDDAFNRKTAEREKAASALSERDRIVLEAAKALEQANAQGDAQKIRTAMTALEAALKGQAAAQAVVAAAQAEANPMEPALAPSESASAEGADETVTAPTASDEAPAAPVVPAKPARPVVAVRGDDRPGMKKSEPAAPSRGGKFGDRRDGGRPGGDDRRPRPDGRPGGDARPGRFGDRPSFEDRGPRLGDVAFRAQRDALEHAQSALRKLAIQAHGEALAHLLSAWEHRAVDQLPSGQDLGPRVSASVRTAWQQALSKPASLPADQAANLLLRLEMAAEVPTPAEHITARRALQLQLLTRRNDPPPAQTWGADVAKLLAAEWNAADARRVQAVLKVLLRG